ncbi:MAG TPA: hypothetical protein VG758_21305, partial [Hyphomicrobiaceae bacterium]|nr:hypothetical protein [Hyphomicrobiaceae bacterium]
LAVQAVLRKLVSRPNSLLPGKKQGISANIEVFGRPTSQKVAVVQGVSDQIPYAREQGIFSLAAGNIRERSGI